MQIGAIGMLGLQEYWGCRNIEAIGRLGLQEGILGQRNIGAIGILGLWEY